MEKAEIMFYIFIVGILGVVLASIISYQNGIEEYKIKCESKDGVMIIGRDFHMCVDPKALKDMNK